MNLTLKQMTRMLYAASAFSAVTAVAMLLPRSAPPPVKLLPWCERLATLSFKHPELAALAENHAPECDLRELRDALRSRH